jgi:hypothetical protein
LTCSQRPDAPCGVAAKASRAAVLPKMIDGYRSATRHTRHDGDKRRYHSRYTTLRADPEGTRSPQGALATICTRTTYRRHSPKRRQPQPMRAPSCSTKTRSIGAKSSLCRCIWNGLAVPCSREHYGTAKPVGSWRALHLCESVVGMDGRRESLLRNAETGVCSSLSIRPESLSFAQNKVMSLGL